MISKQLEKPHKTFKQNDFLTFGWDSETTKDAKRCENHNDSKAASPSPCLGFPALSPVKVFRSHSDSYSSEGTVTTSADCLIAFCHSAVCQHMILSDTELNLFTSGHLSLPHCSHCFISQQNCIEA